MVSFSFWVTLFITFDSLVVSKRNYLVSACLIFICIFMHSLLIEDPWLHAYHGEHVDFYWLYMFLLAFGLFQLVLVSNWYPWACEHTLYLKIFFVSRLGLSYVESFNLVSSYGSTISFVQVLCAMCYVLFYALLHLLYVLDDFGGVRIPYLCTRQ